MSGGVSRISSVRSRIVVGESPDGLALPDSPSLRRFMQHV